MWRNNFKLAVVSSAKALSYDTRATVVHCFNSFTRLGVIVSCDVHIVTLARYDDGYRVM